MICAAPETVGEAVCACATERTDMVLCLQSTNLFGVRGRIVGRVGSKLLNVYFTSRQVKLMAGHYQHPAQG